MNNKDDDVIIISRMSLWSLWFSVITVSAICIAGLVFLIKLILIKKYGFTFVFILVNIIIGTYYIIEGLKSKLVIGRNFIESVAFKTKRIYYDNIITFIISPEETSVRSKNMEIQIWTNFRKYKFVIHELLRIFENDYPNIKIIGKSDYINRFR